MVARVGDRLGGSARVVTLAAAFLIPEDVPFRETLIFAAMVVTAGTLLLQASRCRSWSVRSSCAGRMPARRLAGGHRDADIQ